MLSPSFAPSTKEWFEGPPKLRTVPRLGACALHWAGYDPAKSLGSLSVTLLSWRLKMEELRWVTSNFWHLYWESNDNHIVILGFSFLENTKFKIVGWPTTKQGVGSQTCGRYPSDRFFGCFGYPFPNAQLVMWAVLKIAVVCWYIRDYHHPCRS